jgi:hypothetical protein
MKQTIIKDIKGLPQKIKMLLLKQTISKLEKTRKYIAVVTELKVDTSGSTPKTVRDEIDSDASVSDGAESDKGNEKNTTLFKRMGGLQTLQQITKDVFSVIEQQDQEIAWFYTERKINLKLVS